MSETIEQILKHRTYRHFEPEMIIPAEHVQAIADAARQAPSWMNGQHYSIIRITDSVLRAKIADVQPNNPQIAACSEFWVFVGDAHRAKLCSEAYLGSFAAAGTPDTLITLCTDTALAAQNAVTAAESLGYGTCVVGGVRLIAAELIEWLRLPDYTFPLFGLCIGTPATEMRIKPRLPEDAVLFENAYGSDTVIGQRLHEYETVMTAFAEARERLPYRQKFARYYEKTYAPENCALLKKQGFLTDPDGLPGEASGG